MVIYHAKDNPVGENHEKQFIRQAYRCSGYDSYKAINAPRKYKNRDCSSRL
jgi:hypothetical protein